MRWAGAYLFGYILLIAGIVGALAKLGFLKDLSPAWIAIGVMIMLGLGVMISVANSGKKESISIEK